MTGDSNILKGNRIYLRPIVEADADGPYLQWMNDEGITQYLESRFQTYTAGDLRSYIQTVQADPLNHFFAIVLNEGDRWIGNIKLGGVSEQHQNAPIGIIIGEQSEWGKGYATEAIELIRDYAFGQLDLHKITAGCYSNNPGSAKSFLKAGFIQEGLTKDQFRVGDEWVDGIQLGMINPAH